MTSELVSTISILYTRGRRRTSNLSEAVVNKSFVEVPILNFCSEVTTPITRLLNPLGVKTMLVPT